jgi:hypothetical protein
MKCSSNDCACVYHTRGALSQRFLWPLFNQQSHSYSAISDDRRIFYHSLRERREMLARTFELQSGDLAP